MKHGSRLVLEAGAGVGETIGLDLSDTSGTYVVVNAQGEVSGEGKLALSPTGLSKIFARRKPTRIAIEAGTHSPWVSRLLNELGHEVIVANPRQVKLISQSYSKSDREDAELLGRLARLDSAPAAADPAPRPGGAGGPGALALARLRRPHAYEPHQPRAGRRQVHGWPRCRLQHGQLREAGC